MENIKEIFIDKDVNNGIILFISNGQDNDEIINIVKKALNLKDSEFVQQLWCSAVYFVYWIIQYWKRKTELKHNFNSVFSW